MQNRGINAKSSFDSCFVSSSKKFTKGFKKSFFMLSSNFLFLSYSAIVSTIFNVNQAVKH